MWYLINTLYILLSNIGPSSPIITSVTNPEFDIVEVRWIPPVKPNGIMRNYVVKYFETGSDEAKIIITPELQVAISGLKPSTNYSIVISAVTVAIGSESKTVTLLTKDKSKSIVAKYILYRSAEDSQV